MENAPRKQMIPLDPNALAQALGMRDLEILRLQFEVESLRARVAELETAKK